MANDGTFEYDGYDNESLATADIPQYVPPRMAPHEQSRNLRAETGSQTQDTVLYTKYADGR